MAKLSDNFYLRKCLLEREQVPTQSVMIKKMSPPLAQVYFKSMNYKLKVLAGLEPPLKGGGSDWYIPPEEVLAGRLVLQPKKKEELNKLGYNGIANYGEKFVALHHRQMAAEINKALHENDTLWKTKIEASCRRAWNENSKAASEANTRQIMQAFSEFQAMYTTSITKIEQLLLDASIKEIEKVKQKTFEKMQAHYEHLLNSQATMLYDRYSKKLDKKKEEIKTRFMQKLEESHTKMCHYIHDINFEKHVVVEKLRQLLECMNLACQVYVALKEREECQKEMELSRYEHQKTMKDLQEKLALKDFEILLEKEKERKRAELNTIWKKKICAVIKNFQQFSSYCLSQLPEHADFFIDMEKLMMIQLNEAMENPEAESIFEPEEEPFHTPVPAPRPFYLFCDQGYKAQVDPDLCPKHCTSSASQLPVIVVNKQCIYAACDNFEKFTDKITEFIHGRRGDDNDFIDNNIYEHYFPVNVTSSQQLLELKLESSIMQILQQEIPNANDVPVECCVCRIPYCFCSPVQASQVSSTPKLKEIPSKNEILKSIDSGNRIKTRSAELFHERQPKWESYMDYVLPTKCMCGKRAKKDLEEHLPAYMRIVSPFEEACLPHYKKCSITTLQKLVKKAQGKTVPPPPLEAVEPKSHDASTQYEDQEFETLCTCFSDDEVQKLLAQLMKGESVKGPSQFKVLGDDMSATHLNRNASSFANECAMSLRRLLDKSPQLEEIFKQKDCTE